MQKKTGGKVSNADLVNAVGNLKNAGFSSTDIGAYIIGNLPQQNKDDIYNAINFCFDLEILPIVNEYTPIPGTKDHYDLLKQEIFSSDTDPFLLNNKYLPFWWRKGIDNVQMQEIKDYFNRKVEEGKHKMSIINAIRNKLVLRAFAVVRNDKPFVENTCFTGE